MSDVAYDTITVVTEEQHAWLNSLIDQVCVAGMGEDPAEVEKVIEESGGSAYLSALDDSNIGIEFIRKVVGCTSLFFLPDLLRLVAQAHTNDADELEHLAVALEAKYRAEEA